MSMHIEISNELDMLRERYPNAKEMTFDEYADYFGISRHHASGHFNRIKHSSHPIPYKRLGRNDTRIAFTDFALWLAQKKFVDGKPLALTAEDKKRKRGYCQNV